MLFILSACCTQGKQNNNKNVFDKSWAQNFKKDLQTHELHTRRLYLFSNDKTKYIDIREVKGITDEGFFVISALSLNEEKCFIKFDDIKEEYNSWDVSSSLNSDIKEQGLSECKEDEISIQLILPFEDRNCHLKDIIAWMCGKNVSLKGHNDFNPVVTQSENAIIYYETYNCAICLNNMIADDEKLKDSPITQLILPCKHSFHLNCMVSWINNKKSCPLCEKKLTKDTKYHINIIGTTSVDTLSEELKKFNPISNSNIVSDVMNMSPHLSDVNSSLDPDMPPE